MQTHNTEVFDGSYLAPSYNVAAQSLQPVVRLDSDTGKRELNLAGLALGRLRSKIPPLRQALKGRIRDHHRFLLDSLLRQFRFLEAEIASIDEHLEQLGQEHQELTEAVARWVTIPGVDRVAA